MIGLDTETELFGVRNQAPRLVCISLSAPPTDPSLHHRLDVAEKLCFRTLLEQHIVGHNIAYDMAVLARFDRRLLPYIYAAYWEGYIHDTMIREQLLDIAHGKYFAKAKGRYTLDTLAVKYLNLEMDKSTWRTRYGELIDVPLEQWPQGAKDYATGDAVAARRIYQAQKDFAESQYAGLLVDAPRQAAWAFAYQLAHCWGMVTDAVKVQNLATQTEYDLNVLRGWLRDNGYLNVYEKGPRQGQIIIKKNGDVTRNVKKLRQAVMDAYGPNYPKTPKGQPATDAESLAAHPSLKPHSDYIHTQKMLNTYISVLRKGVTGVIHGKFHLLETGRRGASDNMQTLPQDAGIRECYRARRGFVLGSVDYNSIELRCWAQVMVNWFGVARVPMARLYREDPNADPHLKFAADFFLGVSYEQAQADLKAGDKKTKLARQRAKAVNFGLPGGMGAQRFMEHAAKFGYEMDLREAKRIKAGFCDFWNARPYFDRVAYLDRTQGWAEQEYSGRIRGGLNYTNMANGFFQALAADGHSRSMFMISRECYTRMGHRTPLNWATVGQFPLYGSRIVNALHDEIICEYPEEGASDALERTEFLMVKGMSEVCPDVPIRVEGQLMRHWSKDAKRRVENGKVQVWEP